MKRIITSLVCVIFTIHFSNAQTTTDFIKKDIDTILDLYYSKIFIDSSINCSSFYHLLPGSIDVKYWSFDSIEKNIIHSTSIEYIPDSLYSKLMFRKVVFSVSEMKNIISYLGYSFLIDSTSYKAKNIKITLHDSSLTRYKELIKYADIKYRVTFNKEHGKIFNIRPQWIFESDYTISMIIFEKDFTKASLRINFSDLLKVGWASFEKIDNIWKLKNISVSNIDW